MQRRIYITPVHSTLRCDAFASKVGLFNDESTFVSKATFLPLYRETNKGNGKIVTKNLTETMPKLNMSQGVVEHELTCKVLKHKPDRRFKSECYVNVVRNDIEIAIK